MSNIPQGAQYIWTPAVQVPQLFSGPVVAKLLAYYKFENDEWWVYSDVTGWRLSANDGVWSTTEIVNRYFKEIENG